MKPGSLFKPSTDAKSLHHLASSQHLLDNKVKTIPRLPYLSSIGVVPPVNTLSTEEGSVPCPEPTLPVNSIPAFLIFSSPFQSGKSIPGIQLDSTHPIIIPYISKRKTRDTDHTSNLTLVRLVACLLWTLLPSKELIQVKPHTKNPYLLLDGSLALGNLWLDGLLLLDCLLLELQQLLDMYRLGHDSLPYKNT